ncbi:30S ribosomal protein S6e [Candidatus Woesearchaeota archaeon]|nr:30S ribosomal protein S6e [Candidatus Woesearchaeota archaeon]
MEFKVVMSTKDGKSYQKEFKSPEADVFSKKSIGDKVSGTEVGMPGYEFLITGGSDKCGFPMRKGIQAARKKVLISGGVGYNGKDRNKKKRGGIFKRSTVCGERVTSIIHQVNVKVLTEGTQKLGGDAPAGEAAQ